MVLTGRKVKMFRCVKDPHIPPKPRNAFMMGAGPDMLPGEAIRSDLGIYVSTPVSSATGEKYMREFEITMGNLEVIEYFPEETKKPLKVIKT